MYLGGEAPLPAEYRVPMPLSYRKCYACPRMRAIGSCSRSTAPLTDFKARSGCLRQRSTRRERRPPPRQPRGSERSTSSFRMPRARGDAPRRVPEPGRPPHPRARRGASHRLVTDTGQFQYRTRPRRRPRLADELVGHGADNVHRSFRRRIRNGRIREAQAARACASRRAQIYEGGRLDVSYITEADFHEVGAAEPYSEGIIDYLRAVEGADAKPALIREPPRTLQPTTMSTCAPRATRSTSRRSRDRPTWRRSPPGGRILVGREPR